MKLGRALLVFILLILRLANAIQLLIKLQKLFLREGNVHHAEHTRHTKNGEAGEHLEHTASCFLEVHGKATLALLFLVVFLHLDNELEHEGK